MISGAPELRQINYATRALEHGLLMHIETRIPLISFESGFTYPTALPIATSCSGNLAVLRGVHCMKQKSTMLSVFTEASVPRCSLELIAVMDDVRHSMVWLRIQHECMELRIAICHGTAV